MTTEQFAYWLQGFSEIHGSAPSAEQWEVIKEHLQTCFVKVTGGKNITQQGPFPGEVRLQMMTNWDDQPIYPVPAVTC